MAEDAALVESELDRLGGKTQLIQTIGERMMTCHPSVVNRCIDTYLTNNKVPASVFEVVRNPNGIVAPIVAQEMPVLEDMDILGNPPAYDNEFNFDFLSAPAIPQVSDSGTGTGTATPTATATATAAAAAGTTAGTPAQQSGSRAQGASPPAQQGSGQGPLQVDLSQIQNFDWISGYLMATGGVVPQGPQPQAQTEPVPNPADMDATWQVLVQQLGLGM